MQTRNRTSEIVKPSTLLQFPAFKKVNEETDGGADPADGQHRAVVVPEPLLGMLADLVVDPDRDRGAKHHQVHDAEEFVEPDRFLAEGPLAVLEGQQGHHANTEHKGAAEHFLDRRSEERNVDKEIGVTDSHDREERANELRHAAWRRHFIGDDADFCEDRNCAHDLRPRKLNGRPPSRKLLNSRYYLILQPQKRTRRGEE